MIIYIIIKIWLSFLCIVKFKWIKEIWKLSLSIDLIIMICFFYLLMKKEIAIITQIFIFSFIIVNIFLLYRGINYILENNNKILEKIKKYISKKKQQEIKKFFLKPIVCKIIYYMIWLLPWNIGYWIYFWIVENGWYMRVWITSTRDIIFWKIFKWDSRTFFFNIFKNINNNEIIIKTIWRIFFISFYIRQELLSVKITKYIWLRGIIYMYLTIFYYYLFEELFIINNYLFYLLIILEFVLLYNVEKIINYYEGNIIEIWKKNNINVEHNKTLLYTFKNPFYWEAFFKWDLCLSFWDIIFQDSVSLNILYKYMIFVNKNTKGYFDKQMNIGTRVNKIRISGVQMPVFSIIWNILPRTRYVIINLKGVAYETTYDSIYIKKYQTNKYKINLSHNKNLYLSYYEKTYSKTSLLMFVWILKNNHMYWYLFFKGAMSYYSRLEGDLSLFYFHYVKDINMRFFLLSYYAYILKYDKRILKDINILLDLLYTKTVPYFLEETYFDLYEKDLIKNGSILPISGNICSIKNYKKMFKIMGRIMWANHEYISWNSKLIEQYWKLLDIAYNILPKKIYDNEMLTEKEENFLWFMQYKIIATLRGTGDFVFFILHSEDTFETNIDLISVLIPLKNKEKKWLLNNYNKLYNENWEIKEILEMEEEDSILENFVVEKDEEYLSLFFVILINQNIFFEKFSFNFMSEEELYEKSNTQFLMNNYFLMDWEEYKKYKDYKYFFND